MLYARGSTCSMGNRGVALKAVSLLLLSLLFFVAKQILLPLLSLLSFVA